MKNRLNFVQAIETLLPLAFVLSRNSYRFDTLPVHLQAILKSCSDLKEKDSDLHFLSNELELELDSSTGYLSPEDWQKILYQLKDYVKSTRVFSAGKFYRMQIFSSLDRSIISVSPLKPFPRGWHKPEKISTLSDLSKLNN